MIASVTELNLKGFTAFFRFLPHAIKSQRQASKAPGVISVRVSSKGLLVQRTLSVWADEKSMLDYVRSGAHLEAMKAFKKMANRSHTARFETASVPDWETALKHLREHGKAFG